MPFRKDACAFDPDILALLTADEDSDTCTISATPLTPGQRTIADKLLTNLSVGHVCLLQGNPGSGKTVLLRHVARVAGGEYLPLARLMVRLQDRASAAIEETFLELLDHHLRIASLVIVDDLHLILNVVNGYSYPRMHLFECALTSIIEQAEAQRKKLLFATDMEEAPLVIRQRAYTSRLPKLAAEDYEALCRCSSSDTLSGVDFHKLHDFAPALNYHQVKNAIMLLRHEGELTTEAFREYLSVRNLTSNVDLKEVEPIDWKQLKGVDDVILELEAKIALPFENPVMARHLRLKPKRGVLLAGPPGTGKTTIGRALAHRLRSKFFLIDGTVVAGSSEFFPKVERIFDDAKRNAPSIIFIDDADVIFEEGNRGFYRYLLTMMDGLESASAERVCVMITAMDPTSLPPAMLRSGRIELWLSTRLPGEDARREILSEKVRSLPSPLADVDLAQIAKASHGLTGADLKAVVEDAKLLFAHDQITMKIGVPTEQYFLRAITAMRSHHANYRSRTSLVGKPFGFPME